MFILDTERTAVVNVQPGRIYYRYIVDGNEQYDPDKPNELFEGSFAIIVVGKLFNYIDVADPPTEPKKEIMEMSNEDLEFLVSKLNSGRNSFIENAESKFIQTPKSQYSIITEQKTDKKKDKTMQEMNEKNSIDESNIVENLQSSISKLDDRVNKTIGMQTELTIEDIDKWQK